jgi:hypothetical protein
MYVQYKQTPSAKQPTGCQWLLSFTKQSSGCQSLLPSTKQSTGCKRLLLQAASASGKTNYGGGKREIERDISGERERKREREGVCVRERETHTHNQPAFTMGSMFDGVLVLLFGEIFQNMKCGLLLYTRIWHGWWWWRVE